MSAMKDVGRDLQETIDDAAQRLARIPAERARQPKAPGKWSPQEIIGHLIDSACNNHGRFVRAQLNDDFLFLGYEQEGWVRVQRYATEDWDALIHLWHSYNLHIAHIIENIPDEVALRPRVKHNLDEIAWKTVPQNEPVTLDYFVRDYVAHLKHHLGQIPD